MRKFIALLLTALLFAAVFTGIHSASAAIIVSTDEPSSTEVTQVAQVAPATPISATIPPSAPGAIQSVQFNQNRVMVNGQSLVLTGQPMISVQQQGVSGIYNYMPVRAVLEQMGYSVAWDETQNAVVVTTMVTAASTAPAVADVQVPAIQSAQYNQNKVIFNGQTLDLSGQPMISVQEEGVSGIYNYMPVRAVLEQMGYAVAWDGVNYAVLVTTPVAAAPTSFPAATPAPTAALVPSATPVPSAAANSGAYQSAAKYQENSHVVDFGALFGLSMQAKASKNDDMIYLYSQSQVTGDMITAYCTLYTRQGYAKMTDANGYIWLFTDEERILLGQTGDAFGVVFGDESGLTPVPTPTPKPSPTPAPDVRVNVKMYAENSSVPDFGAFCHIQPYDSENQNGAIVFIYDSSKFSSQDLYDYADLLYSLGFQDYNDSSVDASIIALEKDDTLVLISTASSAGKVHAYLLIAFNQR